MDSLSQGRDKMEQYFAMRNQGKIYDCVIDRITKLLIEKALDYCWGNQIQAAKMLGINRNTLHAKIKKFNINVKRFKS